MDEFPDDTLFSRWRLFVRRPTRFGGGRGHFFGRTLAFVKAQTEALKKPKNKEAFLGKKNVEKKPRRVG